MTGSFDRVLGVGPGGGEVGCIDLVSKDLRVSLTNYGARLLSIEAPDRDGRRDHVLLGFDRLDMILKAGSFGAVLGRYANRIAKGRFALDGATFTLPRNNGENTLHGGPASFSKTLWRCIDRSAGEAVFALRSPDGDSGFPGALDVTAAYTLEDTTLRLQLTARTSAPTPVNLSAHPYFNLAGADALDVCDHELAVFASHYLPTDATQIPTGDLAPVAGTPFDFRSPVTIGTRIRAADPQLLVARGFDHCFVLDEPGAGLRRAARLVHRRSGRTLLLQTDRPALQVYTGNSLDGSLVGHGGTYRQTAGLALEAQAFPDAPNQPNFPSTILAPGETFAAAIVHRFDVL